VIAAIAASQNPFDWRTFLLARHAQHVVLIHFPIALYLAGVALDLVGLWFDRHNLAEAAYYNLSLAGAFAIPAAATGLIAWQWQLEGQKLKGILLEHFIAGSVATVAIGATWLVQFWARRRNRPAPTLKFILEGAGVIAVLVAGHLGGFLSGVNVSGENRNGAPVTTSIRNGNEVHFCGGNADVLVGSSIVEKPSALFARHAFYKHHVGNLAGSFPGELGTKNRLVAPVQDFSRIAPIKHRYACTVDKFVVGPVVNQYDPVGSDDGWRPGFDDARVEFAWPPLQHRRDRFFVPAQQVF